VETAKTLAYVWQKPILSVNHLIGHIYTNFVSEMRNINVRHSGDERSENSRISTGFWTGLPYRQAGQNDINFKEIFPAIVLIVSGGHTELLLMTDHAAPAYATRKRCGRGKYQWLGGTRDDAAGECFDKCARILGLPYPGGPAIEKEAKKYFTSDGGPERSRRNSSEVEIRLPRPMIDQENFDFSFSGLKTALFNTLKQFNNACPERSHAPSGAWRSRRETMEQSIPSLASEVQEAITDVLVNKTLKAAEKFKVKSIIIGGGVTTNQTLREKFNEEIKKSALKVKFFAPLPELCTDNAVGIASAAFFNYNPIPWQKITANPELDII